MKKISFEVIAPPFSINSAYYLKSFNNRAATKVRTKECREWGDNILIQLQQQKLNFKAFKAAFNEKKDAISITLDFYLPESKLYTKKTGSVSASSCDITNIEKLLVDIIFDARFNGRALGGHLITNLDINDKFIVDMRSRKMPSNNGYLIRVSIERVDNRTYF